MKQVFRPYEILNDTLIRLGSPIGDGGYIITQNVLDKVDVLYSYGTNHEISFERDFAIRTGKQVYLYDMTCVETDLLPNMTFYKEGLSGLKHKDTDNLLAHIAAHNDQDKKVLVKMDVEGW